MSVASVAHRRPTVCFLLWPCVAERAGDCRLGAFWSRDGDLGVGAPLWCFIVSVVGPLLYGAYLPYGEQVGVLGLGLSLVA